MADGEPLETRLREPGLVDRMNDWEPVLTQLAELRREVGRAQGMVDATNDKLDALHALLRTTQWWALTVALILAADFVATGLALRMAIR